MKKLATIASLIFASPALAQNTMVVPQVSIVAFSVPSTTVANLPTCNAAANGQISTVTNALTPTLGLAVVGGGAITLLVHCNGTSWIVG